MQFELDKNDDLIRNDHDYSFENKRGNKPFKDISSSTQYPQCI